MGPEWRIILDTPRPAGSPMAAMLQPAGPGSRWTWRGPPPCPDAPRIVGISSGPAQCLPSLQMIDGEPAYATRSGAAGSMVVQAGKSALLVPGPAIPLKQRSARRGAAAHHGLSSSMSRGAAIPATAPSSGIRTYRANRGGLALLRGRNPAGRWKRDDSAAVCPAGVHVPGVAFARALEQRFEWVRKISSAVVVHPAGIALANAGVIPRPRGPRGRLRTSRSPHHLLVILASRLSDLKRAGWSLSVLRLATVGASRAPSRPACCFTDARARNLENGGSLCGAFVGRRMNFAASDGAADVPDCSPPPSSPTTSRPSPTCWRRWGCLLSCPATIGSFPRQAPPAGGEGARPDEDPRRYWSSAEISITDLALLSALPWSAVFVAPAFPVASGFSEVLWLTTLALIAAQAP